MAMKVITRNDVPLCDICTKAVILVIDAPTVYGPWAYMCVSCIPKNAAANYKAYGTVIQRPISE